MKYLEKGILRRHNGEPNKFCILYLLLCLVQQEYTGRDLYKNLFGKDCKIKKKNKKKYKKKHM